VVKTEHAALSILETGGAGELIPHQTPESSAVVLAAGNSLEAKVALHGDNIGDSLLLNLREASFLRRNTLFADLLADIKKVLRSQLHVPVSLFSYKILLVRRTREPMCSARKGGWL
jgi:hypothetical protein